MNNRKQRRKRRSAKRLRLCFFGKWRLHPAGFEPATYGSVGRKMTYTESPRNHSVLPLYVPALEFARGCKKLRKIPRKCGNSARCAEDSALGGWAIVIGPMRRTERS